jgi:hypothetical protein
LNDGFIRPERAAIGGVVAFFIGFGMGQATEGRWHETGWIFTLGEAVSLGAIIGGAVGIVNCAGGGNGDAGLDNCSASGGDGGSAAFLIGGVIALTGFRIWEIVDAFAGPSGHNERLHDLHRRMGYRDYAHNIVPYVTRPQSADGGMSAGLSLRF